MASVRRLYVGGPMSPESFGLTETPTDWDWNHPAFNKAAEFYRSQGYEVVNPAEMDAEAGDVGALEWHEYLRRDIKALADCTHIAMLPGWENSKGAQLEHHIAQELGLTVEYLNNAAICIRPWIPPNLLDGTTEFMRLGRQNTKGGQFNDRDVRELRYNLLKEEISEWDTADLDDDLVEVVDGLLDIIVVAWGSLLAFIGEDKAKAAAAEVVRSNLDKVKGEGLPIFRESDNKILKPIGWRAPDIAGVLGVE
ncbi:Phosphoribosyl-ATP pyrophosphohydrolase [Acinetobacter baumannii]|uniref:Phosphoribosyl-ATP pyrophosphohydrolase n=2 Tax=Acinetobacter baumannii TaxID=470 RepID=A0AAJ0QSI4_ACIBA|nr:Phosphoribosyl-ATP pyrophosphohydrolase [Acinetobacter baumannii]